VSEFERLLNGQLALNGWTKNHFATNVLGLNSQDFYRFKQRKFGISAKMAKMFEREFGISAEIWLLACAKDNLKKEGES